MYREKCKPLPPSYNDNGLLFIEVRLHVQFNILLVQGTQQALRGSCNYVYANLSILHAIRCTYLLVLIAACL